LQIYNLTSYCLILYYLGSGNIAKISAGTSLNGTAIGVTVSISTPVNSRADGLLSITIKPAALASISCGVGDITTKPAALVSVSRGGASIIILVGSTSKILTVIPELSVGGGPPGPLFVITHIMYINPSTTKADPITIAALAKGPIC
jgi:hypothetical protein